MTDQTPEQRVAAALHKAQGPLNAGRESCSCSTDAQRILAADPTLAADLALAEAVRASRLIEAAIAWAVFNGPWDGEWETDHGLLDAVAAIEEALR